MSNNNNSHSSFFYIIIGIFIGGVIALFFAPKKGKDLRKSILSFLDNLQEKGSDKFQSSSQEIQEIYKENKDFIVGDESDSEIKIKEIIN